MATLSDEQVRALRFLARHPGGCTEATLLERGFTAVQLGQLVYAGLAKLRGGVRSSKVSDRYLTACLTHRSDRRCYFFLSRSRRRNARAAAPMKGGLPSPIWAVSAF
jgi:hypothetical protein